MSYREGQIQARSIYRVRRRSGSRTRLNGPVRLVEPQELGAETARHGVFDENPVSNYPSSEQTRDTAPERDRLAIRTGVANFDSKTLPH
jgi:hypothetical protein